MEPRKANLETFHMIKETLTGTLGELGTYRKINVMHKIRNVQQVRSKKNKSEKYKRNNIRNCAGGRATDRPTFFSPLYWNLSVPPNLL